MENIFKKKETEEIKPIINNKVQKIMERETACKQIAEMKLKICGIDLDALCDDEEVKGDAKKSPDEIRKSLENAWMCGLVYFDENKNCLVQKLISPLVSKEQSCDVLIYEKQMSLNDVRARQCATEIEALLYTLSLITGRSMHLLGTMKGQDVQIAMACISFFGM